MLGHKNMNLNIKQFLPAPQNTLTLQAICLNIKNLLLGFSIVKKPGIIL